MNTSLPDMLRCLQSGNSSSAEMTVLERQQARQKWQHHHPQQQQHPPHQSQPQQLTNSISYLSDTQFNIPLLPPTNLQDFQSLMLNNDSVIREFVNRSIKLDPGVVEDNGWPDFGKYTLPQAQTQTGFGGETTLFVPPPNTEFPMNGVGMIDYSLSRTASCPPTMPEPVPMNGKENTQKKRKTQNSKVAAEEVRNKRIKADSEEESKITEQNNSNSSHSNNNKNNSNKESSKNSDAKQDYIHVRARRGQATDSHSLAERVRREKISERMKYLQDLVPGCNKITGKAGMLDEIINYVQSLQRQVEFLSMKLAAVNPRLDINIENLFTKEMFSPSSAGFPTAGTSSEMPNCPPYLPFNSLQQLVSTCGLDMVMNSSEGALQRTRSAPVSDGFLETSCFNQAQPSSSTWETDLQNLYNNVEFNQGRPTSFPPQSFTGILEANNLKMEM